MNTEGDVELIPCNCCGRNFRPDVLRKHEPICIKSNRKQRKVFDSGKQRAQGSDVPLNKTLKPGEIPRPDPKLAMAEAKTKQWRQKHEQLINSFKAARNYAVAKSTGAPLPPPPPPVVDTSLVQCPYCQRRFNEDACNRHVPFCREQHAKLAPKGSAAKKPIYKAPSLKPKQPVPIQKPATVTPNGYGSQSSMQSQNSNTRGGMSSNLPVKSSTKSGLPTRSVARPTQPSPTANSNQHHGAGPPHHAPTSSVARTNFKATPTPPVTTTKTAIRKPAGSTNVTSKAVGFCHECGASFTVSTARFCSECGVRRLAV